MRTFRTSHLLAPCVALAALSGSAAAQNSLGMAEVKALITGNTVHAQNLSNGLFLRAHYEPGGQFVVLRDDGAQFSGVWSVRANGTLCLIVSGEECGSIVKNADGTYTRMAGSAPAFKWLKITPGKDF